MVGRQLPFFSVIVPFWLVWAFAGVRGTLGVWPAVLVAGVSFAVPQFLISNFHGPWLVDVVSSRRLDGRGRAVPAVLAAARAVGAGGRGERRRPRRPGTATRAREVLRAWMPWIILSVLVFVWGLPQTKALLDGIVARARPGARACTTSCSGCRRWWPRRRPEPAVFNLNWLSATGSGILVAALIAAGWSWATGRARWRACYWSTLKLVRHSLLTIAAMLALGFTTRYSGLDATLGPGLRAAPACSIRSSARCWAGWAWR